LKIPSHPGVYIFENTFPPWGGYQLMSFGRKIYEKGKKKGENVKEKGRKRKEKEKWEIKR
jgi:hypothetical protein